MYLPYRPLTGKVANVIVAGKDDDDDDAADEFLVEEKPKDTLDLLTETAAAPTDVSRGESLTAPAGISRPGT